MTCLQDGILLCIDEQQEEKHPFLPADLDSRLKKSWRTFLPFTQVEGWSVLVGTSLASDSPLESRRIVVQLGFGSTPAHLWGFASEIRSKSGKVGYSAGMPAGFETLG